MTMLYQDQCYNESCYKGTAVYFKTKETKIPDSLAYLLISLTPYIGTFGLPIIIHVT